MSVTVKCTSEFRADPGDNLVVGIDLTMWIQDLPRDAVLQAITAEFGSQRDPVTATVGLRATWEEHR